MIIKKKPKFFVVTKIPMKKQFRISGGYTLTEAKKFKNELTKGGIKGEILNLNNGKKLINISQKRLINLKDIRRLKIKK